MADSILTLATTPDGDELWQHGCGAVEVFPAGTSPTGDGLCPCQDDAQGWRRLAVVDPRPATTAGPIDLMARYWPATYAAAVLPPPNGGRGDSAHQVLAQYLGGSAASDADRAIVAYDPARDAYVFDVYSR